MFCSKCGTELQTKLNYCNKCGSKVIKSEMEEMFAAFDLEKPQPRTQSISTAISFIGLGGMIAIVILTLKLLEKNVDIAAVVVIIAMFLTTILAIIYLLLRQMSGKPETPARPETFSEEYQPPKSIGGNPTNRLREPTDSPASVTEDTTRTLDKVLVERK